MKASRLRPAPAVLLCAALLLAPTARADGGGRAGVLDPSFGQGGIALSPPSPSFGSSRFSAIALGPEGDLIDISSRETGELPDSATVVQRRRPGGELDPSFGNGGEVAGGATAFGVQSDRRIVLGADAPKGCPSDRGDIRRLMPDGGEDPSFGEPGCGTVLPFRVELISVDSDGVIFAVGFRGEQVSHGAPLTAEPMVARLTADGALDPSFGEGGIARLSAGRDPGLNQPVALAPVAGGVLLAGGHSVVRFSAAGERDEAYGDGGVTEVDGRIAGMVAEPGGVAVVASRSGGDCCAKPSDFRLTGLLSDGTPDPSFGEGGVATLDLGAVDVPAALAAAPGGGFLLAGDTSGAAGCRDSRCRHSSMLARFGPSGSLDASYGDDGVVAFGDPSGLGESDPKVGSLVVTPGGDAVVAAGGGYGFLVRRLPDGGADIGFGEAGAVVEKRPVVGNAEAKGLAVQPDGGIMVTGRSDAGFLAMRRVVFDFTRGGRASGGYGPEVGLRPLDWGEPVAAAGRRRLLSIHGGSGRLYVVRDRRDGDVDRRYGVAGRAPLPPGFSAASLLVGKRGGALVVGSFRRRMAAYGLTPEGRPARRFGRRGLVAVRLGGHGSPGAHSALVQRNGRITLVGLAGAIGLRPNGRITRGFGHRGRVRHLCPWGNSALGVVPRRGGGVVVACGLGGSAAAGGILLVSFDRAWRRDRRFGRHGFVRPGGLGRFVALLSSRGRAVLVTSRAGGASGGVVLRSYRRTGVLDRSFGRRGRTDAAVGQSRVFKPVGASTQPGGRIVVAGTAGAWINGNRVELLRFR